MTPQSLDRLARQIILIAFFTLFLFVPLTWTGFTHELFEYPKMMLTYALTLIILAAWATRMITQKKFLFRRTPFDIPLILFLISQIISTIISIDFRTSVFGYYTRFHGGLLSTITYLTLFYAFVANVSRRHTLIYLKTILVSGFIGCLYALPEHFGISPSCILITGKASVDCWVQDVQNRIFGTFGQPNWLAAYLVTIFTIPLAFLSSNHLTPAINSKDRQRHPARAWRNVINQAAAGLPYYLLPITYYLTLLFTRSRSGLLALFVTFITFWSLVFILQSTPGLIKKPRGSLILLLQGNLKNRLKKFHWKPFILVSSILLLTTLIFGTEYSPSVKKLYQKFSQKANTATSSATTPPASPKPQVGTQLETGGTESSKIRQIVWRGAVKVWANWPLFGSGTETFAYAYYNFRPPEHNLVSEWDFLYNKAHNEFLNFLATTGIFGLGTYTLLIAWFIYWIIKTIFSSRDPGVINPGVECAPLLAALLSGFLGLAVSNFFGFSTVPVAILFFLYPAIALTFTKTTPPYSLLSTPYSSMPKSYLKKKKRHHQLTTKPNLVTNSQLVLLLITLSLSGYLLFWLTRLFYADTIYARGKNYSDAGFSAQAIVDLAKASQLVPAEPLYHNQLAESLIQQTLSLAQENESTEAAKFAQKALEESELTLKQNKVHLNFYKSRAKVLLTLAQIDPKFLAPAAEVLNQALALSPTDAKLFYNLGLVQLGLNQQATALDSFKKAVELKANYEAARQQLALLLESLGYPQEAKQQWQYILDYLSPNNLTAKQHLQKL